MAVEFKLEHKRGTEYLFFPEQIKVKPELNGRHEKPDIEWLIKDILKNGQLQPVIIRSDGGIPVLVAGYSRWRAVSEINQKNLAQVKLALRCSYFRGSEQDAFLANISENRERNNTTPLDDAYNITRLERFGMTMADIAAVYRETEVWCRGRLALISLCEEARTALHDGRLKPTAAAAIAKLDAEHQRAAVASGKKITASAARAATGKPKKAGMKDVKEILRAVVEDGKYPVGFSIDSAKPEDALHLFCGMVLDIITGKQ